ncbi:hypothetical protein SAY87_011523 [Trapa incisa]|uniref:Uncharacterized protein n=1 Tax=Trapa incisa TaxID=236973 RepID=A0AAN7GG69_9MYRT|nr:hypothetical protein SAY87_011523 [Trapa incisa]
MASLILALESALASGNFTSNRPPENSLQETTGSPSWPRKALNLGCSKLEKDTEPQDSYTQSAKESRAQSIWALLSIGLGYVLGLLSFFTLSSSVASAPKSSFLPDKTKCGRRLLAPVAVVVAAANAVESKRDGSTIVVRGCASNIRGAAAS